MAVRFDCFLMGILFLPFFFFLFKFSSAVDSHTRAHVVKLGWNVTNCYVQNRVFGGARTYCGTELEISTNRNSTINEDEVIWFKLLFLGDEDNGMSNLSVVAWNADVEGVADVIWAAVGEVGRNATLKLGNDGNLVLRNEKNDTVWSTNTTDQGVREMWLTHYGALLLVNSTNGTVWSSFKNPTNKLVCGQVLQPDMELTNGDYRFRAEEHGAVLYFHEHPYEEWSLNTTVSTFVSLCCDSQGPFLQLMNDTGNISDAGYYEQNFEDCPRLSAEYRILTLNWGGQTSYEAVVTLARTGDLTLNKLTLQTSKFQGDDFCNLPNICGQYGLCFPSTRSCKNSCPLTGKLKPIDASNPAAGCELESGYSNSSDTCEMVPLSGIDYYETSFSSPSTITSKTSCFDNCSSNSTCNAAFYHHLNSYCFWIDQIYSLKAASNDYSASFKLCKTTTSAPSKGTSAVFIAAIAAGIPCFLMLIIGLVVYLRKKDGEEKDGILSSYLSEATLRRFSLKELEQITSHFSETLGHGAFGTVYKGQLPDGNYVAVKTLNGSSQEAKDFYAELSILSRVRHFNLVQLLGFCSNKKTRAVVYEYMANRSLDHWLLGKNTSTLNWKARMEIALGSARGMAYLHEECQERVLHLDVKPQNILLDENFYPKVGDFGLSRLLNRSEDHFFMTTICGTPGYLAPELMRGDAIGVESDIYSFGVVLLELLIGFRPIQPNGEEFWKLSEDDRGVKNLVDSKLVKAFHFEEAKRIIKVAALCLNDDPSLRPQMSFVVQMLEGNIKIPQFLTAPQFYPKIQAAANDKFMALSLESQTLIPSSSRAAASTSTSDSMLLPR